MKTIKRNSLEKMLIALFSFPSLLMAQGSLTPSGAPAASMKTLDQIEARIPISQADIPLSINTPGSYYFTGNLHGLAGSTGITIDTGDVTINLNGYTFLGVTASLNGINVSSTSYNITIRNGALRDWGWHGVNASKAYNSSFKDLKAYHNGFDSTSKDGLRVGLNCLVIACQAEGNQSSGISIGSGSSITDSTSFDNGDNGIKAASGCSVNRCTSRLNKGDGIEVTEDSSVVGNTCDSNGFDGDGAGIHVTGSDNRIEDNHLTDSDRGLDLDGANNYVAGNTVRGNTKNYDISPGNQLNLLLGEVPETIEWPASVTLAGSLTGGSSLDGITITSDDVTIDLGGHALIGGTGSHNGIFVSGSRHNITVRNGTVRNWSWNGVHAGFANNSSLENLKAYSNGWEGVGTAGLNVGSNSRVFGCQVEKNKNHGLVVNQGCTVREVTALENGIGISAGNGCSVRDCVLRLNVGDGILLTGDCAVEDNTCDNNGSGGTGAGVHATSTDNRIVNNTLTDGAEGLRIDSTDNYVAGNTVRGNSTNYDLAGGNQLNLLLGELPETIFWSATVKLAGTLKGSSGTNGITIATDDVSIDMDGHALVGVAGSLDGILVSGTRRNIRVFNGTLRNWGGHGLEASTAQNSSLEDVKAYNNGNRGLDIGLNSRVMRCQADSNGDIGIAVKSNSEIAHSLSTGNGGSGFSTRTNCTINSSTASGNTHSGISASEGNTITSSTANQNALHGLTVGIGSAVIDTTAFKNGTAGIKVRHGSTVHRCTTWENTTRGIEVIGTGSTIAQNTCTENGEAGIYVDAGGRNNRIDGNNVALNAQGIHIVGSKNLLIRNSASENTVNYEIAVQNKIGVILITSFNLAVSGSTAPSGLNTTDPWANFVF